MLEWHTCCKGRANCPRVAVERQEMVHVSDDFGVETRMTLEEFDRQVTVQRGNSEVHLVGLDGQIAKVGGDQLEAMIQLVDRSR